MLTFFLLRDRVMLARWGMSLVSGSSARRAVGRAMLDVRTNVARYLLAITAVNLGLGICVALAFQLLGMSNAPLWGVAAALLNFMPFIGIAILALVTLGVGIASFEDPLITFAPFAVFVAIAFAASLWGAGGALVATPALIVVIAFAGRLNAAAHQSGPSLTGQSRQKEVRRL